MSMTASTLGNRAAQRARALPQAQDTPTGTIDLSSEFPSGSTSPALRESTIDAVEQHLCDHYTRRPGIAPLCRAVASSLRAAGVPIDENMVTICGGVAEARYVAVRALATGQNVYLPQPAPTVYQAALDFAGAHAVPFDASGELPDARGGLMIVSSPNPVTGQVVAPAVLERLAAWAAHAGLSVISDESVGPMRPDAPFVRFASLPGMAERTLTIGSFAEVPGLGAWQVSWISGAKSVFTPVRDLKQSITICTAAASQHAALAAVAEVDEGEIAAEYTERQETIISLLRQHSIPYLEPDTVAFVVAQVADSTALVDACKAANVCVGDGAHLGNPGTVRIAVPAGSLADAVEALNSALHSWKGH